MKRRVFRPKDFDAPLRAVFGFRLTATLERKGITQVQLSATIDICQSGVSNYTCGQALPSALVLVRIADTLGVSTDYLLGRTGES